MTSPYRIESGIVWLFFSGLFVNTSVSRRNFNIMQGGLGVRLWVLEKEFPALKRLIY